MIYDCCDYCARPQPGSSLPTGAVAVVAGFDATGEPVYENRIGKWCNEQCLQRYVAHCLEVANKEVQRKREHEDHQTLRLQQAVRDGHQRRLWRLLELLRERQAALTRLSGN